MVAILLSLVAAPALAKDVDRSEARWYCSDMDGNVPRPDYDRCLNPAMAASEQEPVAEAVEPDPPVVETAPAEPEATAMANAEPVQLDSIGFAFDSAELTPAMRRDIANLAERMKAGESRDRLRIVGFTDSTGPADYNMALSERRAQAVSDHLAGQGIARNRMEVSGRGMNDPRATNDTLEGRQSNRRVATASIR